MGKKSPPGHLGCHICKRVLTLMNPTQPMDESWLLTQVAETASPRPASSSMRVTQRKLRPPTAAPLPHFTQRAKTNKAHAHACTRSHTPMHTHTSTCKLISSSGWVNCEEAFNNAPQCSIRAAQRLIRLYKV